MARSFDGLVRTAKAFYAKEETNLRKYAGGMPVGFLAGIAAWESSGSMGSPGDARLGEVGYFQITSSTEKKFCTPSNYRSNPEGNIFLAGLEYNVNAARLQADHPQLIHSGSVDHWLIARLTFAIGYAGTRKLIKLAGKSYGNVYKDLVDYVNETGGIPLGSQSASKVKARVKSVSTQWFVGEKVAAPWGGTPSRVPSPSGIRYCVPKSVENILERGGFLGSLIKVSTALLGLFISERL